MEIDNLHMDQEVNFTNSMVTNLQLIKIYKIKKTVNYFLSQIYILWMGKYLPNSSEEY